MNTIKIKALAFCAAALLALPSAAQSVDLNSASAEELEELPGIGAKTAEKIVRDREENGTFASVEDLARVSGVTSGTISKIDGMAYVGGRRSSSSGNQKISRKKIRQAMQIFAREPTIREVQAAALDQSRAHPEVFDSWLARQRLSGLLPRLTARFDYVGEDDKADRTGGTSPSSTLEDDRRYNARVEARWETHWLLFRNEELRAAREGVRLANLRDRVLNEVTRRFFERRRLLLDLELAPPTDLQDAVRKEMRVQEITADLDTITGGWFGEALEKSGQKPY